MQLAHADLVVQVPDLRWRNANAYSDANSNAYAYTNADSNTNPDTYADANTYSNAGAKRADEFERHRGFANSDQPDVD